MKNNSQVTAYGEYEEKHFIHLPKSLKVQRMPLLKVAFIKIIKFNTILLLHEACNIPLLLEA